MKNIHFVFVIFIFLLTGCTSFETIESTRIAPSEISQSYKISSSRNGTSVTATFYAASGATVDLDAPSRIELNGREMRESKPFFLKGTDYHYDSGVFEPSFEFAFYAADGKIYRNRIGVEPLEIVNEDANLSRSHERKFQLSRPIAANETVSFSLHSQMIEVASNDANANKTATNERYSAEGEVRLDSARTSFTIPLDELEKFITGKANLKIEVTKKSDIQQSTGKGGGLSASYESQNVELNVFK